MHWEKILLNFIASLRTHGQYVSSHGETFDQESIPFFSQIGFVSISKTTINMAGLDSNTSML